VKEQQARLGVPFLPGHPGIAASSAAAVPSVVADGGGYVAQAAGSPQHAMMPQYPVAAAVPHGGTVMPMQPGIMHPATHPQAGAQQGMG